MKHYFVNQNKYNLPENDSFIEGYFINEKIFKSLLKAITKRSRFW